MKLVRAILNAQIICSAGTPHPKIVFLNRKNAWAYTVGQTAQYLVGNKYQAMTQLVLCSLTMSKMESTVRVDSLTRPTILQLDVHP
jgi:hypothetical protein